MVFEWCVGGGRCGQGNLIRRDVCGVAGYFCMQRRVGWAEARTIFDRASSSGISAIFRALPPATAAFH